MFNMCFVKNVACNMEATEIRDMQLMPQGTDMLKQHFHLNEYFSKVAFFDTDLLIFCCGNEVDESYKAE